MTTTNAGTTTADRQRQREARGVGKSTVKPARGAEPPKRRRPMLAALALLLIVGGALLAGLLAVRMDTRVPMFAADHDIAPGTKIAASDLKEVPVAAGGDANLIPADQPELIIGTYARTTIPEGMLINGKSLQTEAPLDGSTSMVSVPLNLAPADLRTGDQVALYQASGGDDSSSSKSDPGEPLGDGLILSVSEQTSEGFTGSDGTNAATATVLVGSSDAGAVIDAASQNLVGVALVKRDVSLDEFTP